MADNQGISDNQSEFDSAMRAEWDVIVIGGGPAGAICALDLAIRGHKTLIIDKDRFPRHKVCGDILIADAMSILKSYGLLEEVERNAFEFNSLEVYSPSLRRFDIQGKYLSIPRKKLDNILVSASLEKDAGFLHGHVEGIKQDEYGATVSVSGRRQSLKCRVCVIATGATVDLARKLGMAAKSCFASVAISCYVKATHKEGLALTSHSSSLLPGYAWIFPLSSDGLYNVGCGTKVIAGRPPLNLKKELKHFLNSFPLVERLMRTGKIVSRIQGSALRMNLEGNSALVNGRVISIGETIGTTLPLSGEGIGKAMASASIASESIDSALKADDIGLLQGFADRIRKELKPRYGAYRLAERLFSHSWLTEFLIRRIASSLSLRNAVERRFHAIT